MQPIRNQDHSDFTVGGLGDVVAAVQDLQAQAMV